MNEKPFMNTASPTEKHFYRRLTVKYMLLFFALASLGMQGWRTLDSVRKSIPPSSEDATSDVFSHGVTVVVCHATVRCPTCRAMETGVRKCLKDRFSHQPVTLRILNYEAPENAAAVRRWQVATAAVVLVRKENGKEIFLNLTADAWRTAGNEPEFQKMLSENLARFLTPPDSEVLLNSDSVSGTGTGTSDADSSTDSDTSPVSGGNSSDSDPIPLRLSEPVKWE